MLDAGYWMLGFETKYSHGPEKKQPRLNIPFNRGYRKYELLLT
jgi:hypothetical protein